MNVVPHYLLTITLFFYSFISTAQITSLTGKVIDAETKLPIPFCHVFLANTTIQTSSDANGDYALINIPDTYTEVVFSHDYYAPIVSKVKLTSGKAHYLDLELSQQEASIVPTQTKTKDVEQVAMMQSMFKQILLGDRVFAEACEVQNLDAVNLSWDKKSNNLSAAAMQPIEIRNNALGYGLSLHLKDFTSSETHYKVEDPIRFTNLVTEDETIASEWEKNRKQVYGRSLHSLLRSIAQGKLDQSDYQLYADASPSGYRKSETFQSELGKTLSEYKPETLVQ